MEQEKDENDINDELTLEGMLQVFDKGTGNQADVRAMLGINNEDIEDIKLREQVSQYSMVDSQLKNGVNKDEDNIDMGFYLNELNVLEFDTGDFGDENYDRRPSRAESWQDWWHLKIKQNELLKETIIQNNVEKVQELLKEDLDQKNADVNCTLKFNGFELSPLLLAIQVYKEKQGESKVIKELLANYADINRSEQKLGITPLINATHLNHEADALDVCQTLCKHRLFEGQPMPIDKDATDLAGNTALHHAALTNKFLLCKYLIEEQNVSTTISNSN